MKTAHIKATVLLLLLLLVAGFGGARPAAAASQISDVTSLVSISKSGLVLNRATNTFNTSVTITNSSTTYILNPMSLVISGLPSGVTVANANGTTTDSNPFISVPTVGPMFEPGQQLSKVVISFADPSRRAFTFSIQMLGDATTVGDAGQWPTHTDDGTGITFSYPTFRQPTQLSHEQPAMGVSYNTIEFSDPITGKAMPQIAINFLPNVSGLTLAQWFAENVDLTGAITAGDGYDLKSLDNGLQVLSLNGPIPTEHLDASGPVPDMYAIVPSMKQIIVVQTIQGNSLSSLGITSDALMEISTAILQSMRFN